MPMATATATSCAINQLVTHYFINNDYDTSSPYVVHEFQHSPAGFGIGGAETVGDVVREGNIRCAVADCGRAKAAILVGDGG